MNPCTPIVVFSKFIKENFVGSRMELKGSFSFLIPMIGLMYLQLHPNRSWYSFANFDTEPANFLSNPLVALLKKEDPIVAGLRELEEETGYVGTNAQLIGSARPNAAILSNKCFFVLVREARKTANLDFDEHEELVTELHSIQNLRNLVKNGEISHSIGLNAIFMLLNELDC